MDCYKMFDNMSDVGSTYDAILHELRTQGLLLKKWEQAWGFGSDSDQLRLDPGDYRYRYSTASLARIVAVFASIDKLQAKYGIVVKSRLLQLVGEKGSTISRSTVGINTSSAAVKISGNSQTFATYILISGATTDDLHLLENPQVLEDEHILPGLDDEIKSMT